jgi:hypothetical protein
LLVQSRRALHRREAPTPRAPSDVATQEGPQQKSLGRVDPQRHSEVWLELEGILDKSR